MTLTELEALVYNIIRMNFRDGGNLKDYDCYVWHILLNDIMDGGLDYSDDRLLDDNDGPVSIERFVTDELAKRYFNMFTSTVGQLTRMPYHLRPMIVHMLIHINDKFNPGDSCIVGMEFLDEAWTDDIINELTDELAFAIDKFDNDSIKQLNALYAMNTYNQVAANALKACMKKHELSFKLPVLWKYMQKYYDWIL